MLRTLFPMVLAAICGSTRDNHCIGRCHKRCTGLCSFTSVQNYVYSKCDVTCARCAPPNESVVTSDGTIAEVNHFCYLGDMLDGTGGAECSQK